MKPLSHYCALIIVVTIGVCAGNISSDYIRAAIVEYQVEIAQKEQERISRIARERRIKVAEEDRIAAIKSRKNSVKAKQLLNQCNEWKAQNAQFDSEVSREKMKEYCNGYTRYVNTGR